MAGARVVLLLITVVLFAAAWSGDHPESTVMAAQDEPTPATSARDLGPLVDAAPAAPSSDWNARLATWETAVKPADRWLSALPMGIAPGSYLVIHPYGQTDRITVDADMLQTFGHDPHVTPQAMHTITVDGVNYVLVRVQERAVIADGLTGPRRM